MSEPFFDFIGRHRYAVSNTVYGSETEEKRYVRSVYQLLPEANIPDLPFTTVMKRRKSSRSFSDKPMSLEALSSLLRSVAKDETSSGARQYPFPSGGAFYALETYLIVQNVEGLEPGVYHYASVDHSMALIAESPQYTLEEINSDYKCVFETIPHVILHMTMVKSRTFGKYGAMSYTLCLTEAGHRGQNLYLAAAALGVGICGMGGCDDYNKLHRILGVDGDNEHRVYGLAIGAVN